MAPKRAPPPRTLKKNGPMDTFVWKRPKLTVPVEESTTGGIVDNVRYSAPDAVADSERGFTTEAGEGDQSLDRDSACRFPTIITHKTDAVGEAVKHETNIIDLTLRDDDDDPPPRVQTLDNSAGIESQYGSSDFSEDSEANTSTSSTFSLFSGEEDRFSSFRDESNLLPSSFGDGFLDFQPAIGPVQNKENDDSVPHMKWEKLTPPSKPHLQVPREKLLDFYQAVELNLKLRNDDRVHQMKRDAEWRKQDAVLFTNRKLSPKSTILGYYVLIGRRPYSARTTYRTEMNRNANTESARNKSLAIQRTSNYKTIIKNAPELEILYIGGLSNLTALELALKFGPYSTSGSVQLGSVTEDCQFYTGIFNGHSRGYYGIRDDHLYDKTCDLYKGSIGATSNPRSIWQIMFRMCDSKTTREIAESAIMIYCRRFNKNYQVEQHFITRVRKLDDDDLTKKMETFADDGVPLFTIVPFLDRSNKYWTLLELTTLPLQIGANELIKIWDSSNPNAALYRFPQMRNAEELLQMYPNPPLCFFEGKIDLQKRCLELQSSK